MSAYKFEIVAREYCSTSGYALVEGVGKGAFKETFHVTTPDGASRALKVYAPGASPDRTLRELEAMVRCSHPNIAKLGSVTTFTHDGVTYVISVEEFLPGGTLSARLSRGVLPRDEVIDLGEQLIHAVEHIAAHGLVHRDIKPDNVLYRGNGVTPVIVDFGLVRDLGKVSLTQTWIHQGPGTPLFAPPEQLLNEKQLIDWRADQFSLGTLLTFSAFGIHPFQYPGEGLEVAVERVANRGMHSKHFMDLVSDASLTALVQMTASWPVHRFRTPADLRRGWLAQR